MSRMNQNLIWVILFSIAMAFMESAVVIYLREIYYPEGFAFPLKTINNPVAVTEVLRELATLIMLVCIAIIAGKKPIERFAIFILAFAIWDIFYYVFLKAVIGWPDSLLTWDILFLIPITWVGPVIAPVINSLFMILLAFLIFKSISKNGTSKLHAVEWLLLIVGSVITIISYVEDYTAHLMQKFTFIDLFASTNRSEIMELATSYIPKNFNWWLFLLGQLFFLAAVILFIKNNLILKKNHIKKQ